MVMSVTRMMDKDAYVLTWDAGLLKELDRAIWLRIAEMFAEQYVADHYQELVAQVDPKAIANLSIAEAATAIRKTLEEKLPSRVDTVIQKEIYQRGLLGGLKRIG